MRSQKRTASGSVKSKSKTEIVLSVEEAVALKECDPDVLTKLDTFLQHIGAVKKDKDVGG